MCKHFVALGWASVCLQWLLVVPNAAAESGNNGMSNTTIKSDTNSVQNIAATQVDNTSTNASDNNSTGNISRSNNNNNNNDNHNHSNPHFKSNRTTIVHLFEWKFLDVAEECINFLGPNGYAGVQLSPVTEHLVVRTARCSHPWWERYQPISYKIATRSGSEDEFLKMTRACNAVGVRIYVDVVLNHMAANKYNPTDSTHRNTSNTKDKTNDSNGTFPLLGNAGSKANANTFDYPSVPYKVKDFHKACMLENYQDAHEVRNCQLDGQPDLDHSVANVQVRIVEFLNKLVDLGVAGFRVDAAKHMWPIDIKHMVSNVKNLNSEDFDFPIGARPFLYLDVADVGLDAVSKTEYTSYGVVSEYLYPFELSQILNHRSTLSALINWGPAMGFLPHQHALVFVDSHDTQRGLCDFGHKHVLTYKQKRSYVMANLFMLAHPYGYIKRIMSSYRYDSGELDQGPPSMQPTFDKSAQCTPESGWICEHRWPAIVNMIALVNSLNAIQDIIINFQTDGPNHVAFCRGHKAFIAINNDPVLAYERDVHTCLQPGIYCDVISGGVSEGKCGGKQIVVNAEGIANIMLPAIVVNENATSNASDAANDANEVADYGVIAIYVGSKLPQTDENASIATSTSGNVATKSGYNEIELNQVTTVSTQTNDITTTKLPTEVSKSSSPSAPSTDTDTTTTTTHSSSDVEDDDSVVNAHSEVEIQTTTSSFDDMKESTSSPTDTEKESTTWHEDEQIANTIEKSESKNGTSLDSTRT